MFSGTTPAKKGGKPDWAEGAGGQRCSYHTNLRRCRRGRCICLALRSWDFFFLRRKRSYWLVSDGGLARSDFCCLKITPAG